MSKKQRKTQKVYKLFEMEILSRQKLDENDFFLI